MWSWFYKIRNTEYVVRTTYSVLRNAPQLLRRWMLMNVFASKIFRQVAVPDPLAEEFRVVGNVQDQAGNGIVRVQASIRRFGADQDLGGRIVSPIRHFHDVAVDVHIDVDAVGIPDNLDQIF